MAYRLLNVRHVTNSCCFILAADSGSANETTRYAVPFRNEELRMLAPGLRLIFAAAVSLGHFGPDENIRVETMGSDVRITAFGSAALVPLLLTRAELNACVDKLEKQAEAVCTFQQRGSIVSKRLGDGHQVTFADPVNANIVDVPLDHAQLARALALLRNPA